MKLKYETAIATLIQFIILSFLNFINGVVSIASTCHANGGDCISNALVSMIYFLLIVGWFAMIWVLGFAAQDRRSKRLAQLLIVAEGMVVLISAFNAKHHPNTLSLVTSLIDLALALWVITIAYRLMRAGGERIVIRQRSRRRKRPTTDKLT